MIWNTGDVDSLEDQLPMDWGHRESIHLTAYWNSAWTRPQQVLGPLDLSHDTSQNRVMPLHSSNPFTTHSSLDSSLNVHWWPWMKIYSEQKNCLTKGQISLVSQIVAQRTKVNSWENYITKVDILALTLPNNKHLGPFVDFLFTLQWDPFDETVFLHTLKVTLHTCITWLNLRYHISAS